jgi:glycosyltransferase involved in cell wall biosynthesis
MCKLVSIIVPCYNVEKYIQEALFSILGQTYRNIEVLCIDDGSYDNTKNIIQKIQELDPRVKYIYQKNQGVCIARNNAINKAQGYYILPIDSDDLVSPNFVEKLVEAIEKIGCDVATPCFYKFEKPFDMQFFDLPVPSKLNMVKDNVCVCASLFKKDDFIKLGGFDVENFGKGFEDYDLWLNFLSKNLTITKVKEAVYFYRQHSNENSVNNAANNIKGELRDKLFTKYPFTKFYLKLNNLIDFINIKTKSRTVLYRLRDAIPSFLRRYWSKIRRFVLRTKISNGCREYKIFKVIKIKIKILEY